METALHKWSPAAAQSRQLRHCGQEGWYADSVCVCMSTLFFSDEGNSLNQCMHFSTFTCETDLRVCVCAGGMLFLHQSLIHFLWPLHYYSSSHGAQLHALHRRQMKQPVHEGTISKIQTYNSHMRPLVI